MCRDHLALADFYRQAFGWTELEAVRSPIFTALRAGPVVVGFHADEAFDLLGMGDRRGSAGATHLTVDLGSAEAVDASVERLVELGAAVVQGPFTTYYDARQVVLTDPEGNVVRVSDHQASLVL
jgi:predicted enzyme related to lactoylglutathione lyase